MAALTIRRWPSMFAVTASISATLTMEPAERVLK